MAVRRLKAGDVVRTSTGNHARVEDLRPDGKWDLRYLGTGDNVALDEKLLELVVSGPVRRWPKHTL